MLTELWHVLDLLQDNPRLGRVVPRQPDVRELVIAKRYLVPYRMIDDETVFVFRFFDGRQHPSRKLR